MRGETKEKICAACSESKPLTDFHIDRSRRPDGRRISCRRQLQLHWYHNNPHRSKQKETLKLRGRAFRAKAKASGKCMTCNLPLDGTSTLRCLPCGHKHAAQVRGIRNEDRARCLEVYGNNECCCCGEREQQFLTVDHANNDGAAHRRSIGGVNSGTIYSWLRRNGFPSGFQILCYNCNCGRHRNGGMCPHKVAVTT